MGKSSFFVIFRKSSIFEPLGAESSVNTFGNKRAESIAFLCLEKMQQRFFLMVKNPIKKVLFFAHGSKSYIFVVLESCAFRFSGYFCLILIHTIPCVAQSEREIIITLMRRGNVIPPHGRSDKKKLTSIIPEIILRY